MIKVDSKEKMAKVNAADKLFCRFRMEGCPACINSQQDWDQMSALAGSRLAPGTVLAEIEEKMAPMFKGMMANGAAYNVHQFPTISIFRNGVFKGEAGNARKKKELLKVLSNLGFMKKGRGMKKGTRKGTRKKGAARKTKRR